MLFRHWSLNLLEAGWYAGLTSISRFLQGTTPGYHATFQFPCSVAPERLEFLPRKRALLETGRTRPRLDPVRRQRSRSFRCASNPGPRASRRHATIPWNESRWWKFFQPNHAASPRAIHSSLALCSPGRLCVLAREPFYPSSRTINRGFVPHREEASFRKMAICNQHFSFFVNFSLILHSRTPFIWTLNLSGNSSL